MSDRRVKLNRVTLHWQADRQEGYVSTVHTNTLQGWGSHCIEEEPEQVL